MVGSVWPSVSQSLSRSRPSVDFHVVGRPGQVGGKAASLAVPRACAYVRLPVAGAWTCWRLPVLGPRDAARLAQSFR